MRSMPSERASTSASCVDITPSGVLSSAITRTSGALHVVMALQLGGGGEGQQGGQRLSIRCSQALGVLSSS